MDNYNQPTNQPTTANHHQGYPCRIFFFVENKKNHLYRHIIFVCSVEDYESKPYSIWFDFFVFVSVDALYMLFI